MSPSADCSGGCTHQSHVLASGLPQLAELARNVMRLDLGVIKPNLVAVVLAEQHVCTTRRTYVMKATTRHLERKLHRLTR